MDIQITQDHLDRGKPRNATACAVALALKDAGFREIQVGPYSLSAAPPNWPASAIVSFTNTPNLRDFVDAHDQVGGRRRPTPPKPGRLLIGWPGMAGWDKPDARAGYEAAAA